MTAPRLPARSFFGDLASRLQTWLGLESAVPVDITGNAVPVVVVGNCGIEEPGYSMDHGRRFAVGSIAGAGIPANIVNRSDLAVVIDLIAFGSATAGRVTLSHLSAADVAGIGATAAAGRYLDFNTTEEPSPLEINTGGAGGAAIFYVNTGANTSSPILPVRFVLMPGCGLQASAGANAVDFSVFGRSF